MVSYVLMAGIHFRSCCFCINAVYSTQARLPERSQKNQQQNGWAHFHSSKDNKKDAGLSSIPLPKWFGVPVRSTAQQNHFVVGIVERRQFQTNYRMSGAVEYEQTLFASVLAENTE
jgi:hypothetical protein